LNPKTDERSNEIHKMNGGNGNEGIVDKMQGDPRMRR
jgi:hypothetical protein